MIDVKKLHKTIDELENHSATLARVAVLYENLEKFKTELDILSTIISKNEALFRKTEADIREAIEALKAQLAKMPIELNALREEIDKSSTAMCQEINRILEASAENQKAALGTLLKDLQSLQSKHRSDIEVAIRNEGAQIQRGLENIVKEKILTIQTMLEKSFSDVEAKIIKQNRYLLICFALTGINTALLLAALWFFRY
ncbi:hypothetical protein [Macellibacteroides fermentans]|uniref:hypothetical protein n=1 Tax=Macellibacteroides fermentans TaxID=879969 RepID=UPI00406C8589